MSRYSKREVALLAELLADKLINTYQNEQIPAMIEGFSAAGFTRTTLTLDPIKLFQMLVIAAYDRRPFTPAAGGFEVIWGIRRGSQSIPQVLEALALFTPQDVRRRAVDSIHGRLDSRPYFDRSLATDGGPVRFARTLIELARLIDDGFHDQVLTASTPEDVQAIHKALTTVHGIGDTIGAKLVKYLLREIGIGRAPAAAFPLAVVWPIVDEYHASEAAMKLGARLDVTLVPLTMGLLISRGEPFAIDALFYLHRQRNWELEDFVNEVQVSMGRRFVPPARSTRVRTVSDAQVAQDLLAVIKEICDASRGITEAEIKRAGLQGIVTPAQIEGSARWLHTEMGELAAEGRAGEMVNFYENCLHSERGQIIGWALQQLGRTSLESEADRFRQVYGEFERGTA